MSSPARFCAQCGATLAPSGTVEMSTRHPAADPGGLNGTATTEPRPHIHAVHRRPFGLRPGAFLAGVSAGTFPVAVILFAVGTWVVGIVVLLLALAAATLLAAAVREEPTSPEARLSRRALVQAGGTVRFGSAIARTRFRAGLLLGRLSYRRARLRRELRAQYLPLGQAVYRDELERAELLKAQARRIEDMLQQIDLEAATLRRGARRHLEGERATVQRTQALPVQPPRD